MKKISVKGLVETYDTKTGRFSGIIETDSRYLMAAMVEFVGEDTWNMSFGKLYRGRTTGKKSQNHHIWGHLQQIAEYTGIDIDTLSDLAKYKAISWGYPFDIVDGYKMAWSERRIDTKQAGTLIEVIHWLGSEFSMTLYEGEDDDE